jgi:Dolichyl-phosphate-mannose-protein mannosyltransferase
MVDAVPHSEPTPPLYYVVAWFWSRIFGTDEAGLRSFSALIGTATVPATYAAARQFLSQRSAFVAAALVAVSPFSTGTRRERAPMRCSSCSALSHFCKAGFGQGRSGSRRRWRGARGARRLPSEVR